MSDIISDRYVWYQALDASPVVCISVAICSFFLYSFFVLCHSSEDLGAENSEQLYTSTPEIKAWAGICSVWKHGGNEMDREVFKCVVPGPSKEQRPEHLHPSGADVDVMTALSVTDQPSLSLFLSIRLSHAYTHTYTHTLTDFMQSYGQDGLESKTVELWMSLAHCCLCFLSGQPSFVCLNSF